VRGVGDVRMVVVVALGGVGCVRLGSDVSVGGARGGFGAGGARGACDGGVSGVGVAFMAHVVVATPRGGNGIRLAVVIADVDVDGVRSVGGARASRDSIWCSVLVLGVYVWPPLSLKEVFAMQSYMVMLLEARVALQKCVWHVLVLTVCVVYVALEVCVGLLMCGRHRRQSGWPTRVHRR
jgi:hypothetical protein